MFSKRTFWCHYFFFGGLFYLTIELVMKMKFELSIADKKKKTTTIKFATVENC